MPPPGLQPTVAMVMGGTKCTLTLNTPVPAQVLALGLGVSVRLTSSSGEVVTAAAQLDSAARLEDAAQPFNARLTRLHAQAKALGLDAAAVAAKERSIVAERGTAVAAAQAELPPVAARRIRFTVPVFSTDGSTPNAAGAGVATVALSIDGGQCFMDVQGLQPLRLLHRVKLESADPSSITAAMGDNDKPTKVALRGQGFVECPELSLHVTLAESNPDGPPIGSSSRSLGHGGASIMPATYVTDTGIVATLALLPGLYLVRVSQDGQSACSDAIEIECHGGVHVSGLSRPSGPLAGGHSLTVQGVGFVGPDKVQVRFQEVATGGVAEGDEPPHSVVVVGDRISQRAVHCVVPATRHACVVAVAVSLDEGKTFHGSQSFTYAAPGAAPASPVATAAAAAAMKAAQSAANVLESTEAGRTKGATEAEEGAFNNGAGGDIRILGLKPRHCLATAVTPVVVGLSSVHSKSKVQVVVAPAEAVHKAASSSAASIDTSSSASLPGAFTLPGAVASSKSVSFSMPPVGAGIAGSSQYLVQISLDGGTTFLPYRGMLHVHGPPTIEATNPRSCCTSGT